MSRVLFDTTMLALQKGLDGTAAQQRAIASNIANLETPGYQPQVVSFEADLRQALQADAKGAQAWERPIMSDGTSALERVTPQVQVEDAGPVRLDGNAVNVEAEVASLTKNSLQHTALLRLLSGEFDMLKTVLK